MTLYPATKTWFLIPLSKSPLRSLERAIRKNFNSDSMQWRCEVVIMPKRNYVNPGIIAILLICDSTFSFKYVETSKSLFGTYANADDRYDRNGSGINILLDGGFDVVRLCCGSTIRLRGFLLDPKTTDVSV